MTALNQRKPAHRATILGLGAAVGALGMLTLILAPATNADAQTRRGSLERTVQPGALPTNDDYRFNPTMAQLGSGAQQCDEDTDGNGAVDVDDLVNVILCWGTPGANCPGTGVNSDIDGNGTVDVDDLVAVILAWGPCS